MCVMTSIGLSSYVTSHFSFKTLFYLQLCVFLYCRMSLEDVRQLWRLTKTDSWDEMSSLIRRRKSDSKRICFNFMPVEGTLWEYLSSLCSDFLALCVLYIFQLFVGLSPISYSLEFHHSLFCYHLVILSNHLASTPDYT